MSGLVPTGYGPLRFPETGGYQKRYSDQRAAELARYAAPLDDEQGALVNTGRLGTPTIFEAEEPLPTPFNERPPEAVIWNRAQEAAGLSKVTPPALVKTAAPATDLATTAAGTTTSGGGLQPTTLTRGNASITSRYPIPAPGTGRIPDSLRAGAYNQDDIYSAGFVRPLERDGGLLDPSKRNAMKVLDAAYGQEGYPGTDPEAVRRADLSGLAYEGARGTAAAQARNPLGFAGDKVAAEMQSATGMNKEQFVQTMLNADMANARREGKPWNKSEATFAAQAAWLDFLGMFVRNQRGGYTDPRLATMDSVMADRANRQSE